MKQIPSQSSASPSVLTLAKAGSPLVQNLLGSTTHQLERSSSCCFSNSEANGFLITTASWTSLHSVFSCWRYLLSATKYLGAKLDKTWQVSLRFQAFCKCRADFWRNHHLPTLGAVHSPALLPATRWECSPCRLSKRQQQPQLKPRCQINPPLAYRCAAMQQTRNEFVSFQINNFIYF